ncbi:phage tail tube protein [Kaistia geumhonensis]|uniref:Secreted protein n=1 Tax=Kaistia geumhonensis TaxID=410839 RepID=A0ABU0M5W8_9HYPH|nr:phage tail tube protein [Kaistia geumhonensis]MCX5478451.1 phage tail tube protein [Kaistia geumhonensis]MDQ0516331.1 putative secreted protein [Kaistia geumhonensis]
MAKPTTLRGSKLLVKIGDGGSPEVFTAPCALTTKSFGRSAGVNEFNVADCDDPDAPIWTERVKSALSSTISGSGTLAQESLDLYEAAYSDQDSRNVQVTIDYSVGPRTYEGKYHLTTLNITGEQDGLIQVEIELQSDGAVGIAA